MTKPQTRRKPAETHFLVVSNTPHVSNGLNHRLIRYGVFKNRQLAESYLAVVRKFEAAERDGLDAKDHRASVAGFEAGNPVGTAVLPNGVTPRLSQLPVELSAGSIHPGIPRGLVSLAEFLSRERSSQPAGKGRVIGNSTRL